MRLRVVGLLLVVLCLGLAAGCGGDDDGGNSEAAAGSETSAPADSAEAGRSHSEASSEELETWQTDLNAVGCYAGAVDGALGPQTEAAIKEFQAAKGLTVDGLLGPQTEGALKDAVAAGEIVCDESGSGGGDSSETAAGGDMATLSSANYEKAFAIGQCSLNADVSNISLRAEADGLTLEVDATEGEGTLGVSGGTESDGITLNGDVTGVSISDDRSFTAEGEFGEPNNAGEAFTLTGACPE